jgi:hypothetical protein
MAFRSKKKRNEYPVKFRIAPPKWPRYKYDQNNLNVLNLNSVKIEVLFWVL